MKKSFFLIASFLSLWVSAHSAQAIEVDGVDLELPIVTLSVMPGGTLSFGNSTEGAIVDGAVQQVNGDWQFKAPNQSGHHELKLINSNGRVQLINIFVLEPFDIMSQTKVNGYKIGQYRQGYKELESYAPPTGFIRVSPELENIRVSPSFRLGQFKCKQRYIGDDYYLLLETSLLIKLELLISEARKKGWMSEGSTFHVMSGWRSPSYNKAIGNKTSVSRHLYGDAADIFIDEDGDGYMDDLNGDGRIDIADAKALQSLAQSVSIKSEGKWIQGGLASYRKNEFRGPFVHVDVRGYEARW